MPRIAISQIRIVAALLIVVVPLLLYSSTQAADLSSRSVTVSDTKPSAANVTNVYNFTIPSVTTLGSIEFEYCSNSPFIGQPCTAPAGFSASSVVLSAQSGETGFTVDGSSGVNRIVITRPAVNSIAVPVSYTFTNLVNPAAANQPVYVRISTFASTDASGSTTDSGAVVFSTASGVTVSGYVPPYLIFCAGVTVALDCTSSGGNLLNFGDLKSTQTKALSSEFSGSTNDPGGFSTSISGNTMTSGNNVIPAINPAGASQTGQSQFGMNLRANSNPGVGAEVTGPGSSVAVPTLANQNQFFYAPQVITSSPFPTEFNKFTSSYIVNVSSSQLPGIYSTTLTYIAVAAF